jgi:hypothetical protein
MCTLIVETKLNAWEIITYLVGEMIHLRELQCLESRHFRRFLVTCPL